MKRALAGFALGLTPIFTSAAQAQLADGGFETQAAGVSNYCYFGQDTAGGPACSSGAWTGSGAGLQIETNSAWPGTLSPDGTHYAFVQAAGVLSQTFVSDVSGSFAVSWLEAGRPSGVQFGDETYNVTINGTSLGTFSSQTNQPFTLTTSDPFNFVLGNTYTLSFNGLTPFSSGDNTVFIDAVSLAAAAGPGPIPEPATWMMMLLGVGAIGIALRSDAKGKLLRIG